MAASRRFCKPEASRAPMAEPNRPTARPKTVIDLAAVGPLRVRGVRVPA